MRGAGLSLCIAAVFLTALAASGCGSSSLIHRKGITNLVPDRTYREGDLQVANVGDYMTSTVQFLVLKAASLAASVIATTEHKGKEWVFTAPAGTYVLAAESPEGRFFLSRERLGFNRRTDAWGGLFVPVGSSSPTEIVWNWSPWARFGDRPFSVFGAPLTERTELQPAAPLLEPVPAEFMATLSYAGVAGGQVRFVYKEFSARVAGDQMLARPAFTQEVAFDYKPGEIYGYKNARFVVHSADQTQISYTLLAHL
jgi:hypothetical protein